MKRVTLSLIMLTLLVSLTIAASAVKSMGIYGFTSKAGSLVVAKIDRVAVAQAVSEKSIKGAIFTMPYVPGQAGDTVWLYVDNRLYARIPFAPGLWRRVYLLNCELPAVPPVGMGVPTK